VRPTRDQILVENAFDWAQRSTCDRLHVGAVVHRDGRILVTGYNGAPAGLPHCDYQHTPEECNAVHAEQNCIAYAARWGIVLDGAEMVTTHQPCISCARSIINSGICHVTYVNSYRLVDGLHLLLEAGVLVEQYLDGDMSGRVG